MRVFHGMQCRMLRSISELMILVKAGISLFTYQMYCIPYTVYLPYTSVNDIIHILATCLDASIVPTVTTVNFSRVWPPLPAASSLWCVFWCDTKNIIILRIVASDSSGLRSWFYMFFPLPSRSWLRAQWWEAFISLQPGSSEWVSFGHVFCDLPFPAFEVQHSMYTLLIYGTFLDDIAPFCDEVGRNM